MSKKWEWKSKNKKDKSKYVVPLVVPIVAQLPGYMPLEASQWEQASSGAAVTLFIIMAKDKGNFLCFELLNKQPVLMNEDHNQVQDSHCHVLLC